MKNEELLKESKKNGNPTEHSSKDQNVSETDLQENLEKMIVDSSLNKYDVISLARRWAYELKLKSEQHQLIQELIAQAIKDILSGRITPKMIQELPPLDIKKKQKSSVLDFLDKSIANPKTTAHSN